MQMIFLAQTVTLEWWKAVILGIVQGVAELLPISSSAHLVLVPWFLGWPDPGLTFDVALHIGTLAAVLIYFWSDLWGMLTALVRGMSRGRPLAEQNARLGLMVVAASIPGALFGVILNDKIDTYFHAENANRSALAIIAVALIVMGLLLAVAERAARHVRDLNGVTFRDAVIIGAAQAFALIPGVSRSGSTITTGLFLGLRRETAARFSFLLSVPITAGAALKQMYDLFKAGGLATDERLPFAIGIITAGLVGYACIAWLLRYLQRATTVVFTVYRVLLGVIVLVLLLVRG
jgi:undecaprenyl-diphosphatase